MSHRIADKFSQFTDQWVPRVIADFNDCEVRIAKLSGAFVWHKHDDSDELFQIIKGVLHMEMRDRTEILSQGDLFVVPRGVEHRPVAPEGEVHVLMLNRKGEPNTGANSPSERTVAQPERL